MSTLRRTRLKGWYEYYRETCVICNKRGGCMINDKGDTVVCIRIESNIQFSKNFPSWVHRLNEPRDRIPADDARGIYIEGNPKASTDILNLVYQTLLESTRVSDSHYQHLTSKNRQMIDSEIMIRGYRSFPDKPWQAVEDISVQLNKETFKGVPGFYENNYGWSLSGREGILIPYRDQRNQIIGFQIRIDNPQNDVEISRRFEGFQARVKEQPNLVQILIDGEIIEEIELSIGQTHGIYRGKNIGFVKLVKGQRYFWLSSANRPNGTGAGDPMPVHVATPTIELASWETGVLHKASSVWITEGALKADIAVEHISKLFDKEELEDVGTTILAIAGVNTWRSALPIFEEMCVQHVNIAFDMDAMKNPKVAFYLKELAYELKSKGYTANLVMWNPEDGKGIDDVLVNRRSPTLKKLF